MFAAISVNRTKRSRNNREPEMTHVKKIKMNHSVGSTFRFLDLPAELRNCIYGMHIEELVKNGVVEIEHVMKKKGANASHEQKVFGIEDKNIFGFSQVSQQVRKEFRPLFMREVAVRIHNRNAMKYLAVFVPVTERNTSRANITIHVGYAGDFLPVLKFCLDAPGIICHFTGLYPKQEAMIDKIWEHRTAWKEVVENEFSAIEACHASDNLLLTMRATSQQPCRERNPGSDNFCAPPIAMQPFFKRLGWSDSEAWAKLLC